MKKKLLTLDDLYEFFSSSNKNVTFTLNDEEIVTQIPALFEYNDDLCDDGQMHVHLQACHCFLNRNNSYISFEDMEKNLHTIYDRPILGNIIQLDDGTYDFHSHDMEINDDDTITYIERPIGHIPRTGNACLKYDEDKDKTYVEVDGIIYEDYGNKSCEIIRNKKQIKVSVELCIKQMSYDAVNKYLVIQDFYFNGITCLGSEKDGTPINEGMEGSNLTIKDFYKENNSCFTKNNLQKGGEKNMNNDKFNLCVSVYDSEYKFELSINEKLQAISKLVNDTYSEADNDFYSVKVFDDYIVMEGWYSGRCYRQNYTDVDNVITLADERVAVTARYMTSDEEKEYDDMISNYESYKSQIADYESLKEKTVDYDELKSRIADYEKKENDAKKKEIIESDDFELVRDSEAFAEATSNIDEMSIEELQAACDKILLDYAKTHSFKEKTNVEDTSKTNKHNFKAKDIEEKSSDEPYGKIFND